MGIHCRRIGASNFTFERAAGSHSLAAAAQRGRYATSRRRRPGLTVRRTRAPRRESMSISVSVLKRPMRPRSRSLTRGWDTRRTLAASRCFSRRAVISFCTWIIRSARTRRCSASSWRNPTSRNTLPVETVTFSLFATSASHLAACASLADQRSVSLPRELHVRSGRLSGSLLEGVQNVHDVRELGDVQDPVLQRCVDPDLPDARSHNRHGLPVERVQSLLDTPKLKARQSARVPRERPYVASRRTKPLERLVRHP